MSKPNQNKILVVGAIVGAIVGMAAGMTLLRRSEEDEGRPMLTSAEGMSLGMLVVGLLRQISKLGEEKK